MKMARLTFAVFALVLCFVFGSAAGDGTYKDENHEDDNGEGDAPKRSAFKSKLALPLSELVMATLRPENPDFASLYYLTQHTVSKLHEIVGEAVKKLELSMDDIDDEEAEEEIAGILKRIQVNYDEGEELVVLLLKVVSLEATEFFFPLPLPSIMIEDIVKRKFKIEYKDLAKSFQVRFKDLKEDVATLLDKIQTVSVENEFFASSATKTIQDALEKVEKVAAPLLEMLSPLSLSSTETRLGRSGPFYVDIKEDGEGIYDRADEIVKSCDHKSSVTANICWMQTLSPCKSPGFAKFAAELMKERRSLGGILKKIERDLASLSSSFVRSVVTEVEGVIEGKELSSKKRARIEYVFDDMEEDIGAAIPKAPIIATHEPSFNDSKDDVTDLTILSGIEDGLLYSNYFHEVNASFISIQKSILTARTTLGHITAAEEFHDLLQYIVVSRAAEFYDALKMSFMEAFALLQDYVADIIDLNRVTTEEVTEEIVTTWRNGTRDEGQDIRDGVDRIIADYLREARGVRSDAGTRRPFGIFQEGATPELKTLEEVLWEFRLLVHRNCMYPVAQEKFQDSMETLFRNGGLKTKGIQQLNLQINNCPATVTAQSLNAISFVMKPIMDLGIVLFSELTAWHTLLLSFTVEELKAMLFRYTNASG